MTARLNAATNRLAAHASVDARLAPNPSPRLLELVDEYDAALSEACLLALEQHPPTGYDAPTTGQRVGA